MTTKTERTPGPWEMYKIDAGGWRIGNCPSNVIARVSGTSDASNTIKKMDDEEQANAAFIVECCNNYERVKAERDALLEAAQELVDRFKRLEQIYGSKTGTSYDCHNGSVVRMESAIRAVKEPTK